MEENKSVTVNFSRTASNFQIVIDVFDIEGFHKYLVSKYRFLKLGGITVNNRNSNPTYLCERHTS